MVIRFTLRIMCEQGRERERETRYGHSTIDVNAVERESHLIIVALVLHAVQEPAHGRSPLTERGRNDRWVHRKRVQVQSHRRVIHVGALVLLIAAGIDAERRQVWHVQVPVVVAVVTSASTPSIGVVSAAATHVAVVVIWHEVPVASAGSATATTEVVAIVA